MKIVVQKVKKCVLYSNGKKFSEIGTGMLVLVGVTTSDTQKVTEKVAQKILNLRIFDDENGGLRADYSSDAFHIYAKHYMEWVDWLCTKGI